MRYDISIHLPDVRLNKRYLGMVKGHLQRATTTATGIAVPANVATSFAVTQATWRFLDNDRVTPQALVAPLRHFARQQLANSRYALAVIDWSKIDYKKHTAKRDRPTHPRTRHWLRTDHAPSRQCRKRSCHRPYPDALEDCRRLSFYCRNCSVVRHSSSRTGFTVDA